MADCKVCGGWFSSTAPSELCPTCERALKRLNGYAVPVVRCKDCKDFVPWGDVFTRECGYCKEHQGDVLAEGFCYLGERREVE